MSVRIHDEENDDTIQVSEMRSGQIGVITRWDMYDENVGLIVQRQEDNLISVGMNEGNGWSPCPRADCCRVHILPNGTHLVIEDNE